MKVRTGGLVEAGRSAVMNDHFAKEWVGGYVGGFAVPPPAAVATTVHDGFEEKAPLLWLPMHAGPLVAGGVGPEFYWVLAWDSVGSWRKMTLKMGKKTQKEMAELMIMVTRSATVVPRLPQFRVCWKKP